MPAGRRQPCLVRVIPGVAGRHAQVAGDRSRALEVRPRARRRAAAIARIEGSPDCYSSRRAHPRRPQLLDVDQLAEAVAPIAGLGTFDTYDLGGGLGVRYTYAEIGADPRRLRRRDDGQARALLPAGSRLIVEPGRSMVARNACTVYRVTTIKRGEVAHVAVDGGMGDNLEVSLTGQRFEATLVGRVGGGEPSPSWAALRIGRSAGRRRRRCRPRPSAICSRCRSPAPTATRCPISTTVRAGSPSSSSRRRAPLVVRRDTWDGPVRPRRRRAASASTPRGAYRQDCGHDRAGRVAGRTRPPARRRHRVRRLDRSTIGRSPEPTLVAVLGALGVPAATEEDRAAALLAHDRDHWRRASAADHRRAGRHASSFWVHVTHGDPVGVWIRLEDGSVRTGLRQLENNTAALRPGRPMDR